MSTFVDFSQLNEWGLIEEINREILHPVGLKLVIRDDGTSPGAVVSKNMYYDSQSKESNYRYQDFLKNRYYELMRKLQGG